MKPRPHAELIKAWADGAEIEYYCNETDSWIIARTPDWREDIQYRIKPQPKPDVKQIYKVEICNLEHFPLYGLGAAYPSDTISLAVTFDGETGKLKAAEVIK